MEKKSSKHEKKASLEVHSERVQLLERRSSTNFANDRYRNSAGSTPNRTPRLTRENSNYSSKEIPKIETLKKTQPVMQNLGSFCREAHRIVR